MRSTMYIDGMQVYTGTDVDDLGDVRDRGDGFEVFREANENGNGIKGKGKGDWLLQYGL